MGSACYYIFIYLYKTISLIKNHKHSITNLPKKTNVSFIVLNNNFWGHLKQMSKTFLFICHLLAIAHSQYEMDYRYGKKSYSNVDTSFMPFDEN